MEVQISRRKTFIVIKRQHVFYYPCVYVFGLISPLFGLALSSADAFWEMLQQQVTKMNELCGLRLHKEW